MWGLTFHLISIIVSHVIFHWNVKPYFQGKISNAIWENVFTMGGQHRSRSAGALAQSDQGLGSLFIKLTDSGIYWYRKPGSDCECTGCSGTFLFAYKARAIFSSFVMTSCHLTLKVLIASAADDALFIFFLLFFIENKSISWESYAKQMKHIKYEYVLPLKKC